MIKMERWRDVEGYENLFQISDHGRLYSKRTKRILKSHPTRQGRKKIATKVNGVKVTFSLARLVAEHFVPRINGKNEVNHIDTDPTNDYYKNLEWVTRQENMKKWFDSDKYRGRMGW